MRALVVICVSVAVAVPAAPALAAPTQGRYFLPNKSGSRQMPKRRAKRVVKKVIRRIYNVRRGTDIYACDRTARDTARCDFAFLSTTGVYTCGTAVANANPTRIKVRYQADTGRCNDA